MSNLDMSEAIRLLAQEKGLSEDALLHVLVDALASAYKRRPGAADEVVVEVNPETMEFTFIAYDVDEDGNWVNERDDTPKKEELGRIAAQTFRQVMSQRIREVERDRKFEEYANREGDIVTGIIQQTDARYTLLDLGRVEALLPAGRAGAVRAAAARATAARRTSSRSARRPRARRSSCRGPTPASSSGCSSSRCPRSPTASSRSRPAPVSQGTAPRSPSGRTTTTSIRSAPASAPVAPVSAWSSTSCAARRSTSSRSATTSPTSSPRRCRRPRSARSTSRDDGTQADVIVPDHQLSLAIGREGQNARLSARLTGVRVDIRSETQVAEGVPLGGYPTTTSSTPRASGSPTPRPARWSGTPPTVRS